MSNVHMDKDKSIISSNNIKVVLINYVHFYGSCESVRDYIIKRLNFIIKKFYTV